jgi:hypothetical protein
MWCHYCDKNNHKTADCRAITKIKQQKKAHFEAKSEPGKKLLAVICLFEEINALKIQFNPEKTTSSKKSYKEDRISPLFSLLKSI